MAIMVKVARVPGSVVEVALEDGATVGQAIDTAGIDGGSYNSLTVNGAPATLDTVLTDGARVVMSNSAKSAT